MAPSDTHGNCLLSTYTLHTHVFVEVIAQNVHQVQNQGEVGLGMLRTEFGYHSNQVNSSTFLVKVGCTHFKGFRVVISFVITIQIYVF